MLLTINESVDGATEDALRNVINLLLVVHPNVVSPGGYFAGTTAFALLNGSEVTDTFQVVNVHILLSPPLFTHEFPVSLLSSFNSEESGP